MRVDKLTLFFISLVALALFSFPTNKIQKVYVSHIPETFPVEHPQVLETYTTLFKDITYEQLDQSHRQQIDCLARNIYFESGAEPYEGQIAVAMVTMNRSLSKYFPKTICEVVQQKRNSVCQFSWWCNNALRHKALNNKYDEELFLRVREVAILVYFNYDTLFDITHGSLFFHADYVNPNWKNLQRTAQIGRHIFYKLN